MAKLYDSKHYCTFSYNILMTSMQFIHQVFHSAFDALDTVVFDLFALFAVFAMLTNPHSYKHLSVTL